jgi:hypothetical protein
MTTDGTNMTLVPDAADAWEKGELGRDARYVDRAPPDVKKQIDEAVCMQLISIRMPQQLIDALKLIARVRGIGYQPLMRDALARFARSEFLLIVKEFQEQEEARQVIEAELAAEKRA